VLGDLKSTPNNAVSQFVLGVYENKTASNEAAGENSSETTAASVQTAAETNSQKTENNREENYQPVAAL
jgi:hypothetical protein